MQFGTKRGAESEEQKSAGGGGGGYAKTLKAGDTDIQFLEEFDDWTGYWEHFDQSMGKKGKSYPCTGDRETCPGCTSDNERVAKASKRYLVNALSGGYVDVWKLPVSLVDTLETRVARSESKTIIGNEYTLIKSGTGLDTEYDAERGPRSHIDPAKFADKFRDHDQILADAYEDAWGTVPDEPAPEPAPTRKPAPKVTPKAEKPAPVKDLGDPPTEPQQSTAPAEASAAEEEVEISEESLRAMSAPEIKSLFKQCQIEAPDTDDVDELADALIAALS